VLHNSVLLIQTVIINNIFINMFYKYHEEATREEQEGIVWQSWDKYDLLFLLYIWLKFLLGDYYLNHLYKY